MTFLSLVSQMCALHADHKNSLIALRWVEGVLQGLTGGGGGGVEGGIGPTRAI